MCLRIVSSFTSILLFASLSCAQGWQWQNPLPQGNTLNSVDFVDASNGWAVGNLGTILHTLDGGVTWEEQPCAIPMDLYSVYFLDTFRGWIVGQGGTILHTDDGGGSWNPQHSDDTVNLSKIVFTDENHGWIVGGRCFTTSDGGETWTLEMFSDISAVADIAFLNSQTGWVLVYQSAIARTDNGGQSWDLHNVPDNQALQCMSFADANHGWIYGTNSFGSPKIFRSVDGGLTWIALPIQPPWGIKQIIFSDSLHGVGAGENANAGFVTRTEDGGETWLTTPEEWDSGLTSISVVNGINSWAVGKQGMVLQSSDSGLTWQSLSRSVTNAYLGDISFADQQIGVAVGIYYNGAGFHSGVILRTLDGWSWQLTNSTPGTSLNSVDLLPSGHGWAVGSEGLILRTVDFGATWVAQLSPSDAELLKVKSVDNFLAWIVGQGVVLSTFDGGTTWDVLRDDPETTYYDISCPNPQSVWISEDHGGILHTPDNGLSWEQRTLPEGWNCMRLQNVCFPDNRRGFVFGTGYCGGEFPTEMSFTTQDSGLTWSESDQCFRHGTFLDTLNGIAVGNQGLIHTIDGGATWDTIPFRGDYSTTAGLELVNANLWYAVGWHGAILRYSGSPESTPLPRPQQPHTFTLSVYPNPFNPSTTLEFNLPHSGKTTVKIFDITGQLVETLTDRFYPQGQHQLTFDGTGLPSGLYLARIEGTGMTATRKMILIK